MGVLRNTTVDLSLHHQLRTMRNSIYWFTGLVFVAVVSRLIPHLDNLTALTAVSVFAGVQARNQKMLLLVPFFAMFLSDLVLNNIIYAEHTNGFLAISKSALFLYTPYLLLGLLSMGSLRKIKLTGVLGMGTLGALLFFAISNFGVWATGSMYPKSAAGLMLAYEAAIPFLRNELLGTLLYGTSLYGVYYTLRQKSVETA